MCLLLTTTILQWYSLELLSSKRLSGSICTTGQYCKRNYFMLSWKKWGFLGIIFDEYYGFSEINSQGKIKKEFWSLTKMQTAPQEFVQML